jgi:serine/threonine-protein kinase
LYKPEEGDTYEAMISPDNKWLVYRTGPVGHPPRSVFAIRIDRQGKPQGKPTKLLSDSSESTMPRLSPDGHWLAYQSTITGPNEVYVRPFPDSGLRVQVSTETGTEPLWSHSGDALFYRSAQGIMSVKVTTGASFGLGERKLVLTGDFLTNASHPNYDVAPDGSGFLMVQRPGQEVRTIFVQNWLPELIARTTTPRWWCRILVCSS